MLCNAEKRGESSEESQDLGNEKENEQYIQDMSNQDAQDIVPKEEKERWEKNWERERLKKIRNLDLSGSSIEEESETNQLSISMEGTGIKASTPNEGSTKKLPLDLETTDIEKLEYSQKKKSGQRDLRDRAYG